MLKKILAVVMASMVVFSSSLVVNAKSTAVTETDITLMPNLIASTDAAQIITYYRTTTSGLLQYRRWNATEGCWVDAAWITAGYAI